MRKTIKGLEYDLKIVRKDLEEMRSKYYKEQDERLKLKKWIEEKFTWWLELIKDSKTPCLKYLIKSTAVILGMKDF